MSLRLDGRNPLAYIGVTPVQPPNLTRNASRPTVNDLKNINIGSFWLYADGDVDSELWFLINTDGNIATWVLLYPTGSGATSFVTNAGTAAPIGGVLNVLGGNQTLTRGGGNTINIDLTNGTNGQLLIGGGTGPVWANITAGSGVTITNAANSITIAASGSGGVATFDTDDGVATPAGGVIVVAGGSNINTFGSGNTVEVNLNTSVTLAGAITVGTTATIDTFGAGVVQSNSSGLLASSNGTNGQVLIGGGSAPVWANLMSSDGSVTITNTANNINLTTSGGGGGGGGTVISTFVTSGTWTPNPLTNFVILYGWNGGGGGGSGNVGGGASGGGGGTGGNGYYVFGPVDFFYTGTGVTVTIGAGGAGGTGSGGNGGASGQTSIGSLSIPLSGSSAGLGNGTGGTSGSRAYVLANGYIVADGTQIGGNGSATAGGAGRNLDSGTVGSGTVSAFVSPYMCASPGGGGAGATGAGGAGGNISIFGSLVISGGAGGAASAPGSPGVAAPYTGGMGQDLLTGGSGGGGGGGTAAGGVGGLPGGGGGGGGAAASGSSGAGGAGGNGMVVFVEFF